MTLIRWGNDRAYADAQAFAADRALDLAAAAHGKARSLGTSYVPFPFAVRDKRIFKQVVAALGGVAPGAELQACVRWRPDAPVDSLEQLLALIAVVEVRPPLAAIRAAAIVGDADRAHLRMVASALAAAP